MSEYAVVGRFSSLTQANLVHGILEMAGLSPRTRNEHMGGLTWHYTLAMGGIPVEVPADRLEEAEELLATRPDILVGPSETDQRFFRRAAHRRRLAGLAALLLFLGFWPISFAILLFLGATYRRPEEKTSLATP